LRGNKNINVGAADIRYEQGLQPPGVMNVGSKLLESAHQRRKKKLNVGDYFFF